MFDEFKTNLKIKSKFLLLKTKYKETHSMFSDCHESDSYKEIINIGYPIVPFLIEDMKNDKKNKLELCFI